MARKYELITELYRHTAARVTAPQTWQSFLTTACRNFRLSFDEQILLFAQRPDATAVLEIERWNQKFGRWVNRGATGIAVFDGDHNGRTRLKYYFDLSDTHGSRFSRPVPVWEVQPSFAPAILETLENSFGELGDKSELGAALLSAAKNAVEDNLPDYLTELNYYKEGSFLEELDDLNIEVRYRTAVQNSVGYMLLSRCGIDPALYFSDDDFRCVLEFNTPNTRNALGAATGDIAQMCLAEISRTVLSLQKQAKKVNRTVAVQPETGYPVTERTPATNERSDEHEQDDLHHAGRLPSARPVAAPGAGGGPWEVRPAAAEIPQGAPQSDLHQPADLRETEQPPAGDRADGPRPDGADLRLTTEEATEKAGSDELPAFLDEKLIGAIISNKDNDLKYNKQQIELYFSIHPDEAQRAEYLRSAYQDRYTEIVVDDVRVGYKPREDGLLMWEGAYLSRTRESIFSWGTVAGLVAQLIEKSEYHINTDIKGLATQEAQQLTLFDLAGVVDPEPQDGGEPPSLLPPPQLPQQVIDEALCIGANDQNSRLIICAYFMKDKPLEENARFLARHYGVNGAGFYLNDRQYAIWYDSEGIRISGGESAQRTSATFIFWDDAASRIRELLDMGRYMPQREIDQAADFERSRLADNLLYLYRDIHEDFDGQFFPTLQKIYDTPKGFPDMAAEVRSLLERPETLAELLAECAELMRAYAHNRNILRFRNHQPENIHQALHDLQREPLTFTANQEYDPQRRFFISTDEIDTVLRGGEDSTDYRLGVYSQYCRFPDHNELAKYLKHYHGEYSGFHGGNDTRTYTSKGLHFSHGSISEPYAKVELSWVKAARRIESLIKQDRFLSDADRAAIPAYEQNHVAQSAYHFFTGISEETPCPFPRNFPHWDAIKYLDQQLSDPAKVEEIYQLMLPIWESTAQDDRYYTRRKKGLDALTAFQDGTFSLFGEKKEPALTLADTITTVGPFWDTFREVKGQEPNKLVLVKLKSGYFSFGEDAVQISTLLHIKLSERNPTVSGKPVKVCFLPIERFDEQYGALADTGAGIVLADRDPVKGLSTFTLNAAKIRERDAAETVAEETQGEQGAEPSLLPALERAKQLINEYCAEEFRDEADFSDLRRVSLAYTTVTDDALEVQVNINLVDFRLDRYVNGVLVERCQYSSIDELIHKELEWLDVETLTSFSDEELARAQEGTPISMDETPQAADTGVETIARYVSGDERIVIQRYPNGQYYNRYGYDEQTGEAASTAGGFTTLDEAKETLYAHRPLAEPDPELLRAGVRERLEERGYVASEELLDVGLGEYAAHGGRGNAEDIADYIENELLSEETPAERIDDEPEEDSPEETHDNLIGKEVTIDDRRFIVDSIDGRGQVSLRDITFQRDVGFPIFRVEHIDTVRGLLKPAEKGQPAVLTPPKPRRERVVFTTLHPEVPAEQRHDLHISDPRLGYGTPGEKFAANTAAIRCLKQIEAEDRLATPEEQATLSRYVGWGGLADCFDERHGHYQELKSLLDDQEYAAARASSLTAFYTSPVIIEAMYQALSHMGFQRGNILEPSCGVGNFIGMLPEDMADSKLYGVELDSISGRIAQQLYQNRSIAVNGFEKVQMPDSFFDVAIGNVPFGDFKVRDRRYDKNNWLIHDYFFGKTLDKVRPGGIIAFITSKGTMDKENPAVRKYLSQRADLIGAIRLPNNAFKQHAGTEVVSDIIFLQKRDRMTDIEPDWVHLDTDENGIRMNHYFVQHSEMVLGEMVMETSRFGLDSTCRPYEDTDLSQQLQEAIQNLHAELTEYEREELDEEEDGSIPADPSVKNFSYCVVDGQIYFRENSLMYPAEVSVTASNRIRGHDRPAGLCAAGH